jgi:hypothetical protein
MSARLKPGDPAAASCEVTFSRMPGSVLRSPSRLCAAVARASSAALASLRVVSKFPVSFATSPFSVPALSHFAARGRALLLAPLARSFAERRAQFRISRLGFLSTSLDKPSRMLRLSGSALAGFRCEGNHELAGFIGGRDRLRERAHQRPKGRGVQCCPGLRR